ncbi:MAG TPA: hypothetical protein VF221_17765 [Chloroflexota bacterium]
MPVGNAFAWDVVLHASLRVLQRSCTPNTLHKTVGVMLADQAGAGILTWMEWDNQLAFAYTWADRELVRPRQEENAGDACPDSSEGRIAFPSPHSCNS